MNSKIMSGIYQCIVALTTVKKTSDKALDFDACLMLFVADHQVPFLEGHDLFLLKFLEAFGHVSLQIIQHFKKFVTDCGCRRLVSWQSWSSGAGMHWIAFAWRWRSEIKILKFRHCFDLVVGVVVSRVFCSFQWRGTWVISPVEVSMHKQLIHLNSCCNHRNILGETIGKQLG